MSQNCQSRLSILPVRNKPPKICQRLVNFCQSGQISPNLVTLVQCDLLSPKIEIYIGISFLIFHQKWVNLTLKKIVSNMVENEKVFQC